MISPHDEHDHDVAFVVAAVVVVVVDDDDAIVGVLLFFTVDFKVINIVIYLLIKQCFIFIHLELSLPLFGFDICWFRHFPLFVLPPSL